MFEHPDIDASPRPPAAPATYGNLGLAAREWSCRESAREEYVCRSALVGEAAPSAAELAAQLEAGSDADPPLASAREEAVRRADRLAIGLRVALLRITVPVARVAAEIVGRKVWFSCGFARAEDFARERLGRSRRWLGELAALHEAMGRLPGLERALTGGDGGRPLGRVAAVLIGRIACPSSTASWITLARRSTVRELRAAVGRARAAGVDSPLMEDDASVQRDGAGDGGPAPRDPATVDDPAERLLVRVAVPRGIRDAFDEAIDLFRAVEGREATVTSFVEALVAEISAGSSPHSADAASPVFIDGSAPLDAGSAPLNPGSLSSAIEAALARSTGNWGHLPDLAPFSPELALAEASLSSLESLARRAGTGGPAELLEQMRALVSLENEIEVRLGRLLAGMAEDGAWTRLRFAGIGHYAEERLGLSRTAAENRARVGRALRHFPRLREAYEGARVGLEATLTVARILNDLPAGVPSDGNVVEEAWLEHAGDTTVKRLRDDARLVRRLRLHHPPDDAAWHASLSRAPGTARRRILRYGLLAAGKGDDAVDDSAGPGSGTLPTATPETALIPDPDVFLRLRLPADLAGRFLAAIEVARRRLSAAADAIPWDAPWPDDTTETSAGADGSAATRVEGAMVEILQSATLPSQLAARTFSIRCRRVPAWVGLLALIEEFVFTWDVDARGASPARDRIYIRDGWRCTAPGCSSRRNLECHHVVYLSRGGGEGECNKTCLCQFHHQRGEHGGLASCAGDAPLGLVWRLGRDGLAEWYRNERRLGPGVMPEAPPGNQTGGRLSSP